MNKITNYPAEAQWAELRAFGLVDRDIYDKAIQGQDLSAILKAFRRGPGELIIAADLRVLGRNRTEIFEEAAKLALINVTIRDIHNNDASMPLMFKRALGELSKYARWDGAKKTAKQTGRKGGQAKLESMRGRRMPEEIAGPIWGSLELSEERRLDLMNPPDYFERKWSGATARRLLKRYRHE